MTATAGTIDWQELADNDHLLTAAEYLDEAIYVASRIKPGGRATKIQMTARRSALWMIVAEIEPCTVRQTFYQATVRGLMEKEEEGYDKTQRVLVELRRSWGLPYAWIADNTRWMRKPRTFESIEAALRHTAETYRRSLWAEADCYVEIWMEKDALAGVVAPITYEYDVPLMVARGYSSITFLKSAAEAIAAQDKPAYIYHLGDYDPWGQNAADKIEKTLRERVRELGSDIDIHFAKLAVRPEQIEHWSLPSRPTKRVGIGKKWEGDSVELDAIHPDDLRALVRDAIERHVSWRHLKALRVAEESERELLRTWRPNSSHDGSGPGSGGGSGPATGNGQEPPA
jgi:hypothetical protein